MSLITGIIGSIITALFGLWAILKPIQFSRFVSLTPYKNSGISEIRATYGGWIISMGIFALISQKEIVFTCLASAWFGAAIVRGMAIFIDKSYTFKNVQFIFGEVVIGLLLLL